MLFCHKKLEQNGHRRWLQKISSWGFHVRYFFLLMILHHNTKCHKNLSVWPFDKTVVLFEYKIVVKWLASKTQKSFKKFMLFYSGYGTFSSCKASIMLKQILPVTTKAIKFLIRDQALRFWNFLKLLISISDCKNFSDSSKWFSSYRVFIFFCRGLRPS